MHEQLGISRVPAIVAGLPMGSSEDPRVYQFRVRDNFCYLVVCPHTGEAIVIDPGYSDFLAPVREEGPVVRAIIATHSHADHCGAGDLFSKAFQVPVLVFGKGDQPLYDRREIDFGRLRAQVIHTPGHTADSVVVRVGGHLFTGDTIFIGTFGYSSGPDGTREMYRTLYERIPSLDPGLIVWPGHDYSVEDLEMILDISPSPGLETALTAYRGARGSTRPGQIFSSLADEASWNLAYMKGSPAVSRRLSALGIDPGTDDFGRYRAIQQMVNAS